MTEGTIKRIAVTFGTGLPLGTHAHFKHDGEHWIAFPASKNTRILGVIDKLIGIYSRIAQDMIDWLNSRPEDADRVMMLLTQITRAQKLREELIVEKAESQTS